MKSGSFRPCSASTPEAWAALANPLSVICFAIAPLRARSRNRNTNTFLLLRRPSRTRINERQFILCAWPFGPLGIAERRRFYTRTGSTTNLARDLCRPRSAQAYFDERLLTLEFRIRLPASTCSHRKCAGFPSLLKCYDQPFRIHSIPRHRGAGSPGAQL